VSADPATTVVIPTHNRRTLLSRALDSVIRQRDTALEVVVVDDGGTDGTAEAVRALDRDDVRVVRHEQSKGVSAARNAGLAETRTPWVAFLDDDDLWAPDKLSAQLARLAQVPGARWSCVGAVNVNSGLHVMRHVHPPASGNVAELMLRQQAVPAGGSGVVVETALARAIGGFDERLSIAADWDLYLRLGLCCPMAAVDRPLVAYYVHMDSMYYNPEELLRELRYMERKHEDLPDGRSFAFNHAGWSLRLAGMAYRLGDARASWRLIRRAARDSGPTSLGRELLDRLRQRASGPRELPFQEPVSEWLDRYRGWPP
jgi:glycosyltransferase involved in cell wall biosynthesis